MGQYLLYRVTDRASAGLPECRDDDAPARNRWDDIFATTSNEMTNEKKEDCIFEGLCNPQSQKFKVQPTVTSSAREQRCVL